MEPRASGIQDIAMTDPVAAYGIALGIPRVPICLNIMAIFSSFDLNQVPVEGSLDQTITQRIWIDNMQVSLQQPNVFAGNVFKTLYDAMLKSQPGISVKVTVLGCPRYLVSSQFTPIENLINQFASRWPAGWPLYRNQSIKSEFILTQAPPATSPNAPPYNVTLTFNGWSFFDCCLDEMCADEAARRLKAMGFWVPDDLCTPFVAPR